LKTRDKYQINNQGAYWQRARKRRWNAKR